MNLHSLDIENNILPQHSQKPFWLYQFSSKHISWHPKTAFLKHFESKFLYISVYLC